MVGFVNDDERGGEVRALLFRQSLYGRHHHPLRRRGPSAVGYHAAVYAEALQQRPRLRDQFDAVRHDEYAAVHRS